MVFYSSHNGVSKQSIVHSTKTLRKEGHTKQAKLTLPIMFIIISSIWTSNKHHISYASDWSRAMKLVMNIDENIFRMHIYIQC